MLFSLSTLRGSSRAVGWADTLPPVPSALPQQAVENASLRRERDEMAARSVALTKELHEMRVALVETKAVGPDVCLGRAARRRCIYCCLYSRRQGSTPDRFLNSFESEAAEDTLSFATPGAAL